MLSWQSKAGARSGFTPRRLWHTPKGAAAPLAGGRRGKECAASLRAEQRLAVGGLQGSPDPKHKRLTTTTLILMMLASFRVGFFSTHLMLFSLGLVLYRRRYI